MSDGLRDLDSLFEEAGMAVGGGSEESEERLFQLLERERGFPQGFWHPEDLEGLTEVMLGCLSDLGVDRAALPNTLLSELVERFADFENESDGRRHQIGAALAHANGYQSSNGKPGRFYAFAEDIPGWESEEPVWLLLTDPERERLLGLDLLHPPEGIEAGYDGAQRPSAP